jgi:hypothetical protein
MIGRALERLTIADLAAAFIQGGEVPAGFDNVLAGKATGV